MMERLREVEAGMQEQIALYNPSLKPAECVIVLSIDADFAALFEVKETKWTGSQSS